MRVLFVHTGRAFLPELPAYVTALRRHGHVADVLEWTPEAGIAGEYDLVFRFGGLLRAVPGSVTPEVHEYHSASTTRWPRLKNVAKSYLGGRSAGRVFLNEFVRAQYSFADGVPFIYRDMGAAPEFLDLRERTGESRYDVVYAGSISGRPGLVDAVCGLARTGVTVGVAGNAGVEEAQALMREPGVEYIGQLASEAVPEFIGAGRYGLNYCPDVYPLNKQTSTKVIEYLVAGRPIVSNRYDWMDQHAAALGYSYVPLESVSSVGVLDERGRRRTLSMDAALALTWPQILESAGFVAFLEGVSVSCEREVTGG